MEARYIRRQFMENLKYVIEDGTIVEVLGVQNFTNEESAGS